MKTVIGIFFCSALIFLTISSFPGDVFAQDLPANAGSPGKSMSLSGGLGLLAVRDQAISDERYSGSTNYLALDWEHFQAQRGFHLEFEFHGGSRMENRNLSAEIILISLELDYLYSIGSISLLNKSAAIFLGPSTGADFYIRQQDIARRGNSEDDANSFFGMFPVGIQSQLRLPLSRKFTLEAAVYLNALAAGFRFPSNKEDELDVKLLHAVNGFKGDFDLVLKYAVIDKTALELGLKQHASRISRWDEELLLGGSSLVLGLRIGL